MADIKVSYSSNRFAILNPVRSKPRSDIYYNTQDISNFYRYLGDIPGGEVVGVDFEFTGGDWTLPEFNLVGAAVASTLGSCYIDVRSTDVDVKREMLAKLAKFPQVAHNISAEAGVYMAHGIPYADINFVACTYAMLYYLANEGFPGQEWGEKWAERELLGWGVGRTSARDEWMVANGYGSKCRNTGKLRPDLGCMGYTPPDILGEYCAGDADGCWQLYHMVLLPAAEMLPPQLGEYMAIFMDETEDLLDMQRQGIPIDIDGVREFRDETQCNIERMREEFRHNPEVAVEIRDIEVAKAVAWYENLKPVGRYTKSGAVSKTWQNRVDKYQRLLRGEFSTKAEVRDFKFNTGSGKQVAKLLYEHLYTYEVVKPHVSEGDRGKIRLDCNGMELDMTKSGALPTDKDAYRQMGDVGKVLASIDAEVKLIGYLNTCISRERGGRLHLPTRLPGTLTGRPAGTGGLNYLQLPHSPRYLRCWLSEPGMQLIDCDHCYSSDTQILTEYGWVPIPYVGRDVKVWQVDPDTLAGEFVIPTKLIRGRYTGDMYEIGNSRGKLRVTSNHKMLYVGQPKVQRMRDRRWINTASEGIPNTACSLQISSTSNTFSDLDESDIWISAMLAADGSMTTRRHRYDIQVSKPRKRDKIRELLGRSGTVLDPRGMQKLETERWSDIPHRSKLLCPDTKCLNFKLIGSNQIDILVDAIAFWDGYTDGSGTVVWSTIKRSQADELQAILATNGYEAKMCIRENNPRSSKPLYTLRINKGTVARLRKDIDIHMDKVTDELIGCVTVPKGFILVRRGGQTFVSGNSNIEARVLAEMSGDAELYKIFGPDAPPGANIFLHTGAQFEGEIGDLVRRYYAPELPNLDRISTFKREHANVYGMLKVFVHSGNYGAGAYTQHRRLILQGHEIELRQVEDWHERYAQTYRGTVEFRSKLTREWMDRGGWVLNGLGTPSCVDEGYLKDIVNRVIQRTAHGHHMRYRGIVKRMLRSAGIRFIWMIPDFYDQLLVNVDMGRREEAFDIIGDLAYNTLNMELGGDIPITGEAQYCETLASAKE